MHQPPDGFRFTAVSYLTLLLLAVLWPLSALIFPNSQLDMLKEVVDPVSEVYYPTMIVQLVTMLLVVFAVRSEKADLADVGLSGFNRWTIPQALAFVVTANLILSVLQVALFTQSPDSFTAITSMVPRTSFARWVWVILCAIVAVSEEVTYRGYILTRITRLAGGRAWVGVFAATIAFASGHLYQGLGGLAIIGIYGLMFAGLYLYTGSLYPLIVAHFLQDVMILFVPDLTK
jgi:membrane protease YdiL (CAAX protease family)